MKPYEIADKAMELAAAAHIKNPIIVTQAEGVFEAWGDTALLIHRLCRTGVVMTSERPVPRTTFTDKHNSTVIEKLLKEGYTIIQASCDCYDTIYMRWL